MSGQGSRVQALPSPRVGKRDDVWLNSDPSFGKWGHAQAGPSGQPGFRFVTGPAPGWRLWMDTQQYRNGEMFVLQCYFSIYSQRSLHEKTCRTKTLKWLKVLLVTGPCNKFWILTLWFRQLKLDYGSASHLIFTSKGWYDLCKDVTL